MKVQHRFRRDGGITVVSTHYLLDASGCVDVPEEHATLLMQSELWRKEGDWGNILFPAPVVTLASESPNGRLPRTKEQLMQAAMEEGIIAPLPVEPPKVEPISEVPTAEIKEETKPAIDEAEVIEISEKTSRAELLAIAKRFGLKVASNVSKAELLALLEDNHDS